MPARTEHPLLCPSLGVHKTLVSFTWGTAGARPKVYLQASLHADELPGMLVAHHLRGLLDVAEREARIKGQVVLVPVANPLGLAQRLDHKAMGRFDLGSSQNFNRHYPDLAGAVIERMRDALGPDAATNVALVRRAVGEWLDAWVPGTELDSLRRALLRLSHDADVVVDLHCDWEAVMHLYVEEPCWAALQPLAAFMGCQAVLLAHDSGGGPFDECLSGLWWQLAERLAAQGRTPPLPQACASTTLELRGQADVDHGLAETDARALLAYLEHMGVVDGIAGSDAAEAALAVPALRCTPTPLSGSQTLTSPVPGVLVYRARPGARLAAGDLVAEVIDPSAPGGSRVHRVTAGVAGVFYAAVAERYVLAGGEIGKIAGATPFRTGPLLGA